MERALRKDDLLVGVDGKDVLRDAFDAILSKGGPNVNEEVYQFIDNFGKMRGLRDEAIDPVIELLEAGGVQRNRAAREIMGNMVTLLRNKIKYLNQQQLSELLDRSYSYLTVPELAPVAITTLEHMKHVRSDLWTEIVNNGLDDSPYTDLPLTIKRRIWKEERTAFEYEVGQHIDKVSELQPPTLESLMVLQTYDARKVNNKPLKDLQQLVHGMGENNYIAVTERLYEKANTELDLPKKMAIANLFHDFIHNLKIRGGNAFAQARIVAREVDNTNTLVYDRALLQTVRDSLPCTTQYPLLVLLNTSTYSRDFIAECLVARLRKLAEKLRTVDEQHKQAALKNLARDTDLQNLTFICMFTLKLSAVQTGNDIVQETETEQPTTVFYPMMIQEIANDQRWFQDEYHRENAVLPNPQLHELVSKGPLERRVVSTYCRYLLQNHITIGLRRFHHILDTMIPFCHEVNEIRESTLARGICELLSRKPKK